MHDPARRHQGTSLSLSERREAGERLSFNWHNPDDAEHPLPDAMRRITALTFGAHSRNNPLGSTRWTTDLTGAQAERDARLAARNLRNPLEIGPLLLWTGFLALIGYGVVQIFLGLDGLGWWFLGAGVLAVMLLLYGLHLMPVHGSLTTRGREMQRYLAGLERFVTTSEANRIAWLSNVDSAPQDEEGRVKLYEELLPWAIVFGAEKSWQQVLGGMYSRFPEVELELPELEILTDPLRWAEPTKLFYNSGRHRHSSSYWGRRAGTGAFSQVGEDLAMGLNEWASGVESLSTSTRSSGRGWRGGRSGGGGAFGGFSGGGIGGGGGGRR